MKQFIFGFVLAVVALFNVPAYSQGLPSNNVIETINNAGAAVNNCAIPANTEYNIYISYLRFLYTSTATVGGRIPTLRVIDAAGNALARIPFQGSAQTASGSVFYYAYENAQTTVAGGTGQINVPTYFVVPRGGCVQIVDSAAIDNADTFSAAFVVYTQ